MGRRLEVVLGSRKGAEAWLDVLLPPIGVILKMPLESCLRGGFRQK